MTTKTRTLRVTDELWQAAQERAASEGTDVSAIIRKLLRYYVDRPVKAKP